MSFIVSVLVLITGNVSVTCSILATSDALSFAVLIKSLLVASRVFGSVSESSNGFGSFGGSLKFYRGRKNLVF
jgi:hypothetical protein